MKAKLATARAQRKNLSFFAAFIEMWVIGLLIKTDFYLDLDLKNRLQNIQQIESKSHCKRETNQEKSS